MLQYRLYCRNDVGAFVKAYEIEATSDQEAIRAVREMKLPTKCELWERTRLVMTLDAHQS